MGWREQLTGWRPGLWAGWRPNGVGEQKPNHYKDMAKVAWANRNHPVYAAQILTKGACDGCALGVAGLHDWTIDGVHLCTTRLNLLELNTADPFDPLIASDVAALRGRTGGQLRALGRLGHPMRRRRGEPGFRRVSWDEALSVLAAGLRAADPDRVALYLTSRGITNEVYYAAAKAARALGVANIDSAARVCHAPSTVGLRQTVGVAATTCSFQDVIEAPLVVLWGANPANNQPVFMKYLYLARRRGCRVVVVNPYLEPGLDRYWVPSNVESALFGTRMCDLHVPVRPGGDVALANAALKLLVERGGVDDAFVAAHTEGFDETLAALADQDLDDLLRLAGRRRGRGRGVRRRAGAGRRCDPRVVDGHHPAPRRGRRRARHREPGPGPGLGRPRRGRAHAHQGPLGGAGRRRDGCLRHLPAGRRRRSTPRTRRPWPGSGGSRCRTRPGLSAPEMVEAAGRGELDVLWMSGGNFLDVLPDPPAVEAALAGCRCGSTRTSCSPARCSSRATTSSLLPVATRYEQEGGGTETTTERRIVFSPEIPRRVGEARSEWRLFADVASRVRPDLRPQFSWPTNQDLRAEIARVVPFYAGIETLADTGDAVQWGGRHLCVDGAFPTPSGRGRFSALTPPRRDLPDGAFVVSTRRGKQFNSMVHADVDPLTGAGRDAVMMDPADAADLGVDAGDRVVLRSADRHLRGRRDAGPPPGPHAPGALARGQRAHRGRPRPPRAPVEGPRLQRGGTSTVERGQNGWMTCVAALVGGERLAAGPRPRRRRSTARAPTSPARARPTRRRWPRAWSSTSIGGQGGGLVALGLEHGERLVGARDQLGDQRRPARRPRAGRARRARPGGPRPMAIISSNPLTSTSTEVAGSSSSVMAADVALKASVRSLFQPRSSVQTVSAVSVAAASAYVGCDAPHPPITHAASRPTAVVPQRPTRIRRSLSRPRATDRRRHVACGACPIRCPRPSGGTSSI